MGGCGCAVRGAERRACRPGGRRARPAAPSRLPDDPLDCIFTAPAGAPYGFSSRRCSVTDSTLARV